MKDDVRLRVLLKEFEAKSAMDTVFLENIHSLILEESENLFEELFYDTPLEVGKTLSKTERESQSLDEKNKSLIYGEVDYSSFYRVLRKLSPAPGLTFYDLGSGTGKVCYYFSQ